MLEEIEKAVKNAAANVECETEKNEQVTLEEMKEFLISHSNEDHESFIYFLYQKAREEMEKEDGKRK